MAKIFFGSSFCVIPVDKHKHQYDVYKPRRASQHKAPKVSVQITDNNLFSHSRSGADLKRYLLFLLSDFLFNTRYFILCTFVFFRQCEEAMAVLQNDNEQLEQEKSGLKERLKQLTKTKLVDDLMQKKIGVTQKTSALQSNPLFNFVLY